MKKMHNIIKNIGSIKFKDKNNEDIAVINSINKIFKDKRGYVVKMPPRRSPVVCCMSGGADAVSNIFILMNEFGYEVYPFFINRGQSCYKWEKASVDYYDKLFKKKFSKLYNKTKEIKINTPAKEYKNDLRDVKKKCYEKERSAHVSYPARNSIIFLTGMEYAISMQNKGKKINTVFIAHVASDTSFHCSLTWQRILNLEACHILNDYNFQYISLPIEVELGNYYDKEILIGYCEKNNLDLSKTRTCIKPSKTHCGTCPCCWDRRRCYLLAGIKDKTKYLKPYPKKPSGYY